MKKNYLKMKNNYLIVFLDVKHKLEFLIIQAESSKDAVEIISKLPKVVGVISVWREAEDE